MSEVKEPPTRFAPSARLTREELLPLARAFRRQPLPTALLDALSQMVVVLEEHRQIVFANKAMARAVGREDLDALVGQRPGEAVGCLRAMELPGGCGTTEFCSTCGAVRAMLSCVAGRPDVRECSIPTKGQALDLRVQGTPFEFDGRKLAIFELQDISSVKRREVLERVFFHDLLNLAAGLDGLLELLPESSAEERQKLMGALGRLAKSLLEEIRSGRDLAAAEAGDLVVQVAPVDALVVAREICAVFEHHPAAQGRRLVLDAGSGDSRLETDATLLRRILGNLVKNALEASSAHETVTVGTRADRGGTLFTVTNPAYMPRPVQLQVFQRSFSTKGAGRGLGTYGVKLIGEAYLGGEISFSSSPDKGTTFYVRFPPRAAAPR